MKQSRGAGPTVNRRQRWLPVKAAPILSGLEQLLCWGWVVAKAGAWRSGLCECPVRQRVLHAARSVACGIRSQWTGEVREINQDIVDSLSENFVEGMEVNS